MFRWRRTGSDNKVSERRRPSYEEAKEATRRAVFLNTAAKTTSDAAYKQGLAELFRACRSEAIKTGAEEGRSEAETDAAISQLCDFDVERLKGVSDDEFRLFVRESGEIVTRFLAILN